MKNVQILICLIFTFSSSPLISQTQPENKEGFYVTQDGKLYWKGGKPVYLFISENPDGSDATRLTSEKTSEYTNPMYLDTEGVNYIRSQWAIDKDGNYAEPRQEVMFEVYNDSKAPASIATFNNAPKYTSNGKVYYGKNLSIDIKATDQVSGVRSIMTSQNNSAFADYTSAIEPTADRNYMLSHYATDNVGNKEEPKQFEFTVDITNPNTAHSIDGDNLNEVLSPRSTITLNSTDNSSGVKSTFYKIDDGEFKMYIKSIKLSNLVDGLHKLTYYSVDNVNNKEEPKEYAFYVDKIAPEVVASIEGDQFEVGGNIYASSRTKIKLESTDNKSGVQNVRYSINGSEETVYSEAFNLPEDSGEKKITFYGSDKVNNNFKSLYDQSSKKNKSIRVDITPPELNHEFLGEMVLSRDTTFISSRTQIRLSSTDSESGLKSITYKINGGAEQIYSEPFTVDNEGFYQIEYFGTDQVNNKSTSSISFVNDNTGPVIETILSMEPVGSISLDDIEASLAVYSSGVKLYLGATDGVIDTKFIYYSINGENERMYTKPVNLGSKGVTSMTVRALDKLGNETSLDPTKIFIK